MKNKHRQSPWRSVIHDAVFVVVGIALFVIGVIPALPDVVKIGLMVLGIGIIAVVVGWY